MKIKEIIIKIRIVFTSRGERNGVVTGEGRIAGVEQAEDASVMLAVFCFLTWMMVASVCLRILYIVYMYYYFIYVSLYAKKNV